MDALLYATLQILCLIYVTVGSHAATDKEGILLESQRLMYMLQRRILADFIGYLDPLAVGE